MICLDVKKAKVAKEKAVNNAKTTQKAQISLKSVFDKHTFGYICSINL